MSFDLAIWKRSTSTKTAMIVECYDAIIENKDHEAMDFFDEKPLFEDMEVEFGIRQDEYFGGDIDKSTFLYSTGGGEYGNWILLNLDWSTHQETQNKIVTIALKHGLMVYDPQVQGIWGNKRPPKIEKSIKTKDE